MISVAVGVSLSTVNRWRSTEKVANLNELMALAKYFNVPVSYFYDERPSAEANYEQ